MHRFRLQFASGLRVSEKPTNLLPSMWLKPVAPRLALLGDIGHLDHPSTHQFLQWCDMQYDKVIWVPGYLELSGAEGWINRLDRMREVLLQLNLTKVVIGTKYSEAHHDTGLLILATTLWHWPEDRNTRVPYSHHRQLLTLSETMRLVKDERHWIEKGIHRGCENVLTLTYSPLYALTRSTHQWKAALMATTFHGANYSGMWNDTTFHALNDVRLESYDKERFWEWDPDRMVRPLR